jgi:hypothetical protein
MAVSGVWRVRPACGVAFKERRARHCFSASPPREVCRGGLPSWVKKRNARCEQMFSAFPPIPDIAEYGRHVRSVPIGDIPRGGYALIVRYALRLPESSFVIDGETVVLRRAGRLGADAATGKDTAWSIYDRWPLPSCECAWINRTAVQAASAISANDGRRAAMTGTRQTRTSRCN